MNEVDFEWYETELIKQYSTWVSVAVIITLSIALVLLLAGSSVMGVVLLLILGLGAIAVGFSLGVRDIIKNDPSHVGLSSEGIRLRYRDGHHKDTPWINMDGIIAQGWNNHPGIKNKDGSVTTLENFPKNIITRMEMKLQEMRISKEKMDPKGTDQATRTFKAKKKIRGPEEEDSQQIKMQAKFQGICPNCGIGIFPGQMIVKEGDGWIHERCADSETEKEIVLCTCGHSKGGHVKGVCMAGGCSCRGFRKEAV